MKMEPKIYKEQKKSLQYLQYSPLYLSKKIFQFKNDMRLVQYDKFLILLISQLKYVSDKISAMLTKQSGLLNQKYDVFFRT